MSSSNELIAIVEISKNSRLKYEINKDTGRLYLDRIVSGACVYPHNYGYIEETLDGDGDALDVMVVSQEALHPGVEVPVRILGALRMIDGGERDTKLIGVISVDARYNSLKTFKDLPTGMANEIVDFFNNYKKLDNKEVVTNGFVEDLVEISKIIQDAKKLYLESCGKK
ncbi:inorganic pyrophosphatase [Candidatus Mycoplasma haematohominis]|uniref:inorganic diphosphatase n=1 Tax=Candidatus Mycoplasma haematohominis TaxID=1494318 RepID=A0A478FPQ8_9MOLU|nr:inorganic pyrophosphatase [Candidatus Mycoplasma haemohominis]